jgi:SAM-dependent methyltransferase
MPKLPVRRMARNAAVRFRTPQPGLVNHRGGKPANVSFPVLAQRTYGGAMADEDAYMLSQAETDVESARLQSLQQASDPFTIQRLEATGVGDGWRCLEVGAGGGSIARWLGERVGATGSVVATDIDLQRLGGLTETVEMRRHDIAREDLETAAYDLVHCRFLLEHLAEPHAALRRMAAAGAPGGWLVVEESDAGLSELAGAAESAQASTVLQDVFTRFTTAGVFDAYLGRRLPGLVSALGLDTFGVAVATHTGGRGHPAYDTFRLAWPSTRAGAAAAGIVEDDLRCVDEAFANSTFIVGMTTFAVWGQLPQ